MFKSRGFWTLVLVAFVAVNFLVVGVLTATTDVPTDIKIENKGYKKDKKKAVAFSHKKHSTELKVACNECHHDYQGGKNVWSEGMPVKKCKDCHDPNKKKGKTKKLQNAFHSNCKNCHKKLAKEGKSKDAPYKKCTACHQK